MYHGRCREIIPWFQSLGYKYTRGEWSSGCMLTILWLFVAEMLSTTAGAMLDDCAHSGVTGQYMQAPATYNAVLEGGPMVCVLLSLACCRF